MSHSPCPAGSGGPCSPRRDALRFGALAALLFATLAGVAHAVVFQLTDEPPVSGYTQGNGAGLNEKGQIVGWSAKIGGDVATVWKNGVATNLGIVSGAADSFGAAINNAGDVVGWLQFPNIEHPFLWHKGTMKDLGLPKGFVSAAPVGISSSGAVAITASDGTTEHPFRWKAGKFTQLPLPPGNWRGTDTLRITPGGAVLGDVITGPNLIGVLWPKNKPKEIVPPAGFTGTQPVAVNKKNHVAGQLFGASQVGRGYLWISGHLTDMGLFSGNGANFPRAMNNKDQIVGRLFDPATQQQHPFIWTGGHFTDLGLLPGFDTGDAFAVNDSGEVVGYCSDAAGNTHAFFWKSGTMTDLGVPAGYSASEGELINNHHQIACEVEGIAPNTAHVFLATP